MSTGPVSLVGLSPHSTYHLRAVARNARGDFVTGDRTFRTLPRMDINRDGIADLLMVGSGRYTALLLSYRSGVFSAKQAPGPIVPATLSFRGGADMDGDGKSDLVFFNTSTRKVQVWYMNGMTARTTGTVSGSVIPQGYDVAGLSDFTRDGCPDLVLLNKTTGQCVFWILKRTPSAVSTSKLGPKLPIGFAVSAVDDLNGDGQPDLLLWNSATHATKLVILNPSNYAAVLTTVSGPAIPTGWQLLGVDSFTGTDAVNWVLYNPVSRATAFWIMRGASHVSTISGPTLPVGFTPTGTK